MFFSDEDWSEKQDEWYSNYTNETLHPIKREDDFEAALESFHTREAEYEAAVKKYKRQNKDNRQVPFDAKAALLLNLLIDKYGPDQRIDTSEFYRWIAEFQPSLHERELIEHLQSNEPFTKPVPKFTDANDLAYTPSEERPSKTPRTASAGSSRTRKLTR